jgi:hypothetical protein
VSFAVVESTTLATVAYDNTEKVLRLEFRSREIYHYFGVPATVHEALLRASSKGMYFNRVIRGRFPYRRASNFKGDGPDAADLRLCQ